MKGSSIPDHVLETSNPFKVRLIHKLSQNKPSSHKVDVHEKQNLV